VGEVSASITKVPATVDCIDIQVASGARVVDRQFNVQPGQPALLVLQGLPLGDVVFNGMAYPTSCSNVGAASVADYATDPVAASLVQGVSSSIAMQFHVAGAADVGINFDDAGALGGVVIAPSPLAFGVLFCGASPQSDAFGVMNTTANPITVSAAVSAGAPLTVSPTSTSIPAGGTATFVATETTINAPYAIGLVDASITLTTNIVFDAPHVVPAPIFVGSAVFQISNVVNNGNTETAVLTNSGNESAPFAFTKNPATSTATVTPSSGTLGPGQSVTLQVGATTYTPFVVTTFQLTSSNELCQAGPSFSWIEP
jgi:hypothetical protein